ncbi:MAG TPA: tyrosine--tRNA ligase [Candidatus Limnocylindria bacterium]|jgi:tyrosyl-tRNA synthetase
MSAEIIDDLDWRGLIADSTDLDALRATLAAGPITFYCGFDPTAPSLHFGNLVQLVTMRRFQQAGHRPIAVVGGATGLVGDPSGKSAERALNEVAVVEAWVERIRPQIEHFLAFDGDNAARMVNNLEWTGPMTVIEFLRDIGKHFSIARMLAKESVSARVSDEGISFTEFSYQILQAMDYLELFRRYGCVLQSGGSDQWGNLTAGVDLIRRVEGATVHALATPLVTRSDGQKYGKTEAGAIWLDPDSTSPFAFYQYFLNQADADAVPLLKVFSFRSRDEIEELARATAELPEARAAQRALAQELTELVHGADEASRAIAASAALFGDGELANLDEETVRASLREVPRAEIRGDLPPLLDLLVATGLARSLSDARRTVSDGGIYLNNRRVTDAATVPAAEDLIHGRWLVLRRGKRQLAAVERVD